MKTLNTVAANLILSNDINSNESDTQAQVLQFGTSNSKVSRLSRTSKWVAKLALLNKLTTSRLSSVVPTKSLSKNSNSSINNNIVPGSISNQVSAAKSLTESEDPDPDDDKVFVRVEALMHLANQAYKSQFGFLGIHYEELSLIMMFIALLQITPTVASIYGVPEGAKAPEE